MRWAATRMSSPAHLAPRRFFKRALRDCHPAAAKLVEFARLRAEARQKLQILDRQETADRRRHSGFRGSRAAPLPPRLSSIRRSARRRGRYERQDRQRWSALAFGENVPGRGRRRFDCRTRRSPRMSCSPTTAKSGASNPCSSAMTASGRAPAARCRRLMIGRYEIRAV